jgi:hypothetical protein
MKHYTIISSIALFFYSCQECKHAAQYVVPMYLNVTPAPRVVYGQDTITVTAYVPYETADLRLPGYPVNIRRFKPPAMQIGISHILQVGHLAPLISISPHP